MEACPYACLCEYTVKELIKYLVEGYREGKLLLRMLVYAETVL